MLQHDAPLLDHTATHVVLGLNVGTQSTALHSWCAANHTTQVLCPDLFAMRQMGQCDACISIVSLLVGSKAWACVLFELASWC